MQYKFDESSTISYGYFECLECGSTFYGGGPAIHESGCTQSGYTQIIYHYSPKELERWGREVLTRGFAANLPLSPNGLSDHLLEQAIASQSFSREQIRNITEAYVRSINADRLPAIMERLEELFDRAALQSC